MQQKAKSSQLKSLLGLPVNPQKDPVPKAAPIWGADTGAPRSSGNSKSLKEIQEEEEKNRKQQEAVAQQNAAASIALSVQAAPKWKIGSGAKATSSSSPSLSEIMQQEEKAKKVSQTTTGSSAPATGNSWAAKAGKMSTGGSYNAAATSTAASDRLVSSTPPQQVAKTPVAEQQRSDVIESAWKFSDNSDGTKEKPSSTRNSSNTAKSSTKSDFGGSSMPANTAEWCTAQLTKMKKSTDLTLIQFCYTLQSPVEIREYFAEYLGSTPEVCELWFMLTVLS